MFRTMSLIVKLTFIPVKIVVKKCLSAMIANVLKEVYGSSSAGVVHAYVNQKVTLLTSS